MSANEFDELIRHKFDETDIAFSPNNWERMSQQLNKVQQPHKNSLLVGWPALAGIAASITLLIALPMLWLQDDNNGRNNVVMIEQRADAPPAIPVQTETAIDENNAGQKSQSTVPTARNRQLAKATKRTADIVADKPIVQTKSNDIVSNTTDHNIAVQSNSKPSLIHTTEKGNLAIQNPDTEPTTPARTSINLIGGFNYNAASAGFMVGASANRKLNDKLYVEGNLAYVNSSVGSSPFGTSTKFEDQFDATPSTNGFNSGQSKQDNTPVQYNLSYLQFSPVMGYHISERFSLSAGPDLQQLLNTESYFITNLPTLDMGVLGKAEFGITEKLKAGVQYRAGINNMIQNRQYTERNYMQVQVRYSIFNK